MLPKYITPGLIIRRQTSEGKAIGTYYRVHKTPNGQIWGTNLINPNKEKPFFISDNKDKFVVIERGHCIVTNDIFDALDNSNAFVLRIPYTKQAEILFRDKPSLLAVSAKEMGYKKQRNYRIWYEHVEYTKTVYHGELWLKMYLGWKMGKERRYGHLF